MKVMDKITHDEDRIEIDKVNGVFVMTIHRTDEASFEVQLTQDEARDIADVLT